MIGQRVQRLFDAGFKIQRRGNAETAKIGAAEGIRAENPMHIAALHPARARGRALGRAVEAEPRAGAIRAGGLSDMDLVAGEGGAARRVLAALLGQMFERGHRGFHIQMTQPRHPRRRAFDPLRIGDGLAQHLIAATKAKHMAAAPDMGGKVDVPPLGPEGFEVGDRGFTADHEHQIGLGGHRAARHDHPQVDARLGGQRVEVIEIGDPGQARHGDNAARPA